MKKFDQQWEKLVTLARHGADQREVGAPYGFAVRVAARAAVLPPSAPWALFERFAFRGLMVAAVFGVCAMALGLSTFISEPNDDYANVETVAEILDLT